MRVEIAGHIGPIIEAYDPLALRVTADGLRALWLQFEPKSIAGIKTLPAVLNWQNDCCLMSKSTSKRLSVSLSVSLPEEKLDLCAIFSPGISLPKTQSPPGYCATRFAV